MIVIHSMCQNISAHHIIQLSTSHITLTMTQIHAAVTAVPKINVIHICQGKIAQSIHQTILIHIVVTIIQNYYVALIIATLE
jgi:hypothetical protein